MKVIISENSVNRENDNCLNKMEDRSEGETATARPLNMYNFFHSCIYELNVYRFMHLYNVATNYQFDTCTSSY